MRPRHRAQRAEPAAAQECGAARGVRRRDGRLPVVPAAGARAAGERLRRTAALLVGASASAAAACRTWQPSLYATCCSSRLRRRSATLSLTRRPASCGPRTKPCCARSRRAGGRRCTAPWCALVLASFAPSLPPPPACSCLPACLPRFPHRSCCAARFPSSPAVRVARGAGAAAAGRPHGRLQGEGGSGGAEPAGGACRCRQHCACVLPLPTLRPCFKSTDICHVLSAHSVQCRPRGSWAWCETSTSGRPGSWRAAPRTRSASRSR